MGENFSAEQLRAIELRGKHILVSASAGSGKTTVMTERVLSLLSEGHTLEQMLIVTFTRAAAADMKEKLAQKLARSTDTHIKSQLNLLSYADISTLHSFCQRLISTYFYATGVDPEFSVLEDGGLLFERALDQSIKEFNLNPSDDFIDLMQIFSDSRSDFRLKGLIRASYNSFILGGDGQNLDAKEQLNALISQIRQDLLCRSFNLRERTVNADFKRNFKPVCSLICAIESGNGEFLSATGRVLPQFYELNEEFKALKEEAQELFELTARINQALPMSSNLLGVIGELRDRTAQIFSFLKRERSALDFFDLELYALEILNSSVGGEIRDKYKFIFVDEYQDINPLQDKIIGSLRADNLLFLVGDIKQSIYAFRGCEPDIFALKMREFALKDDCCVIELNRNYRSCDQILRFVNRVFEPLMTKKFGGIDYKQNASFVVNDDQINANQNVKMYLIGNETHENEPIYDITKHKKSKDLQANAVFCRILDILANENVVENGVLRPALYKDIAVLCRSNSNSCTNIALNLSKNGIPVSSSFEQRGSDGVDALICYLKMLANPLDDVALINCLKSYFCGLSDDDLAQIRLDFNKTEHFYEAVELCLNSGNAPKRLVDFFESLEFFRNLRVGVGELCSKIVTHFEYFHYLFALGGNEAAYLEMFLDQAALSEGLSLYEFLLDYSGKAIEGDETDAVKIMTVHASKGLEFPFVLLIDVQKRFNLRDIHAPVLYFKGKGAIKHYSSVEADSPEWLAHHFAILHRRREEEMRLLYVALTRAKSSLDIFCTDKGAKSTSEADSALSWWTWLSPHYHAYIGNLTPYEPPKLSGKRVAPPPDDNLVELLKTRFNPIIYNNETKIAKTYVTALIKRDEDDAFDVQFDEKITERGTLYHKAMDIIDFSFDLDAQWSTMPQEILDVVDFNDIKTCINALIPLINGKKYLKEQGFMFNHNGSLVQGIIDLLIIDNQNAIIIDYKTGAPRPQHSLQLDIYSKAVSKILNKTITKKLIYSFSTKQLHEL